jgi:hypothetical protein
MKVMTWGPGLHLRSDDQETEVEPCIPITNKTQTTGRDLDAQLLHNRQTSNRGARRQTGH